MDGIRVVVQSTGVSSFKWNALDHMYQIASENIAKYSIQEVLDGLKNKATFGTDFPAIRKYYPVVHVLDDRIVMFDPAQPWYTTTSYIITSLQLYTLIYDHTLT